MSKNVGDTGLGYCDAELVQLADDSQVAPAGVLPGEAADQLDGLGWKCWSSASSVAIGPASPHVRPMPGEDRLRRDEEPRPASLWDQAREQGDKRSIGPGEATAAHLSAEHGELVAEHEDLSVLGGGVHAMDSDNLEHATDHAVEERQPHSGGAWPCASSLVKPDVELLDPSGSRALRLAH